MEVATEAEAGDTAAEVATEAEAEDTVVEEAEDVTVLDVAEGEEARNSTRVLFKHF